LAVGEVDLKIIPPDLAVALAAKGIGTTENGTAQAAWTLAARLDPHNDGTARDAVRLAVFELILARQAHIAIGGAGIADLTALLQNAGRSLKLWRYEYKARTSRSARALWEIENEYHVQALLWTILAPVFSDLEDEEYLPSVGHKHPRADHYTPSSKLSSCVQLARRLVRTSPSRSRRTLVSTSVNRGFTTTSLPWSGTTVLRPNNIMSCGPG
jgi:hypothetical protein